MIFLVFQLRILQKRTSSAQVAHTQNYHPSITRMHKASSNQSRRTLTYYFFRFYSLILNLVFHLDETVPKSTFSCLNTTGNMKFRDIYIFALNKPSICWNYISLFYLQHISHHYFTACNSLLLILSNHCRHCLFEKVRDLLRTTFKPKSLQTYQYPIYHCNQHYYKRKTSYSISHSCHLKNETY